MDPLNPQETPNNTPVTEPIKSASLGDNQTKLFRMLTFVLGGVSIILLILVMVFATRAFINDSKLSEATQQGQKDGAAAQKKIDEAQLAKTQNSDFRTYTAPESAGSFTVDIPKSWSLEISTEDGEGSISGIAMPDYVETKLEQYALRFSLLDKKLDEVKKPLDSISTDKGSTKKKVTMQEETVSGIKSFRYTGQISSKIPNGTIILIPLRDKTFSIQTDDNTKYLEVYNTIVKNLRLNP